MHRPDRPDRPLVVKCSFERCTKRITFSSARNCSYDLLRSKVEQCFSLFTTPYGIAYKDDDGEVADITTDSDLTEAIQYFQAGSDDPPLSSAASILSGRSFGSRKITLRVQIAIDYDGPSLSDTSSLASLEEYKGRSGSQTSLSFSSHHQVELDDDSVTVSSRNAGGVKTENSDPPDHQESSPLHWSQKGGHSPATAKPTPCKPMSDTNPQAIHQPDGEPTSRETTLSKNPFSDGYQSSVLLRYPEDPWAVFERLKFEEASIEEGFSLVDYHNLPGDDRGVAWLRDQTDRTMRSMLGALPVPSHSDEPLSSQKPEVLTSQMGDLALQRDPRGKYYYSYTSVGSSSQTQDSGCDDSLGVIEDAVNHGRRGPRPTSMHLNWLASQQIPSRDGPELNQHFMVPPDCPASSAEFENHYTSRGYPHIDSGIPPDVLQYLPVAPPPPGQLTECAECGVVLDAIRYVCTTCGQSAPSHRRRLVKGKGKNHGDLMSFPPPHDSVSSSSHAGSSRTMIDTFAWPFNPGADRQKPLPSLPFLSPALPSLVASDYMVADGLSGYELCSGCIQSVGVNHAIEVGFTTGSSPGTGNSPSSSQEAQSQWIRSAPKQKGQLRHGYLEKAWGHRGWEDVEQDDCDACKCSTCNIVILNKRYKCASCPKFNLCRACYSQVHLIHPAHAFLVVPDKPRRSFNEPETTLSATSHLSEEQSMLHPGVKCAHCLLEIVGARFHCAICESIEICSNCESAGLPGNLDSSDGGHNSSHIMIKIPYPVAFPEVQAASRRAVLLWTGRDAANVQRGTTRSRPSSVVSSYSGTIVGFGRDRGPSSQLDHHMLCNICNQPIVGVRYQCASCSSSPTPYSLCASCEVKSYMVHDPMHVFFKLPRPVQQPLQSPSPMLPNLYQIPAGPLASGVEPQDYLKDLLHAFAVCDRCMTRIQGEWFRCAYCGKDLCDACEELDTHDDTHVFLVFKSTVDMQLFRSFADLENPTPVIPYPVYCS